MPQKTKSLLFLSCFIISAILYYNTGNTSVTTSENDEMVDTHNNTIDEITISSQNDKIIDTHNTHIDEITISSFEDEVDEDDEEEGKEYSD